MDDGNYLALAVEGNDELLGMHKASGALFQEFIPCPSGQGHSFQRALKMIH